MDSLILVGAAGAARMLGCTEEEVCQAAAAGRLPYIYKLSTTPATYLFDKLVVKKMRAC